MDGNSFKITGERAALYWGHRHAADLGPWSITADTLTATILSRDAFRTSQLSLTLKVSRQNAPTWTWSVSGLHIAGDTLTAQIR